MPNYCSFQILAKGEKKSIKEFVDLFLIEYSATNEEDERHNNNLLSYFARTWLTCEPRFEYDGTAVCLTGWCAWSIYSCMMHGYPQQSAKCPTIMEVSKELKLHIQIASEEPGCCFTEFYEIINGELVRDEGETIYGPEYDFEREEDEEYNLEFQEQLDDMYAAVYDKLDLF